MGRMNVCVYTVVHTHGGAHTQHTHPVVQVSVPGRM